MTKPPKEVILRPMGYLVREVLRSLRWGGRATLVAVSTTCTALIVLGLFLAGTLALYRTSRRLMSKVQVEVYLKDGVSPRHVAELKKAIASMPGVAKVFYVDKDSAAEEFRRTFGAELLSLLPENPLPASLRIRLKPGPYVVARARELAGRISKMKGVEAVNYGRGWTETMERWLWIALGLDLLVSLAVGLAVVSAVAGTVRLTVWARREVVEVMRLVGATDGFIRRPFVLEGIVKGLAGGASAALILTAGYRAFGHLVLSTRDLYFIIGGCILAGAYLGLVGSRMALEEVLG